MQNETRSAVASVSALSVLVASSAALLTGCSLSDDVISGMGSQQETAHGQEHGQPPGPDHPGMQSNALVVTPRQHAFLDDLRAAGVHPSSDLNALSIGSYVCQARAAKQTDDAVWEFIAPLVRGDQRVPGDGGPSGDVPAPAADAATADYIRIATARLC